MERQITSDSVRAEAELSAATTAGAIAGAEQLADK
jgi:hypothetical protein